MILRQPNKRRRQGAAMVETAFVLLPVLMLIFGVFQFGRLLMDWNVLNNAAREGCRYAIVNNTSPTLTADVTALVNARMGGETKSFSTFTITISGTHNGTSTTPDNLVAGDFLTVTVSGQYKFLNLPIPTPTSMNMNSAVTMVCEGAT
jgi:Flp pilus assembly protein TadG